MSTSEPIDYETFTRELAGRIFYKMLQNGEEGIRECENDWLNEYADILYVLYPKERRHIQTLVDHLNMFKYEGIRLRLNDGFNEDTDDLYILQEIDPEEPEES